MTQAVNLANFANNLDSSGGVSPSALNAQVPISKGGTNATTASAARTNLGLGTIATQNANSVAITGGTASGVGISGGTIDGSAITNGTINNAAVTSGTVSGAAITGGTLAGAAITSGTMSGTAVSGGTISGATITGGSVSGIADLAVADGGTGASTASAARSNLGLVIGTDIPSPTGTGASGTWPVDISGSAAKLNGQSASFYQTALGYTPVQQGTGIGQSSNTVKIGWDNSSKLLCTVDSTDQGAFVFDSNFKGTNQSLSSPNGYQKLPGGLIIQWGTAAQTASNTTISFPIAFPNACLNVQQTLIGSSVSAPGVIGITTTSFVSNRDPAVPNLNVNWLAIGF